MERERVIAALFAFSVFINAPRPLCSGHYLAGLLGMHLKCH